MKQISAALVKAKKEFQPALKNAVNPHLKNRYADLGACLDAVDDALLNNGIFMFQETSEDESGVTVETVFLHESGEELRCGKLHVPAPKQDPQGYGSALTYARRYSLSTACGIAAEDDDGNAGSKQAKPKQEQPLIASNATAPASKPNSAQPKCSEAQWALIEKLMRSHVISDYERDSMNKRWKNGTLDGSVAIKYLQDTTASRKAEESKVVVESVLKPVDVEGELPF